MTEIITDTLEVDRALILHPPPAPRWTKMRQVFSNCFRSHTSPINHLITQNCHMQGCALTAPGCLRRLTFSFGQLKKSSQSPGRALLLLMQCSVNRAEKFNILVLAC